MRRFDLYTFTVFTTEYHNKGSQVLQVNTFERISLMVILYVAKMTQNTMTDIL